MNEVQPAFATNGGNGNGIGPRAAAEIANSTAGAKPARRRKPSAAGAAPAQPRTRTVLGKVEKAIISALGQDVGQSVDDLIRTLNGVAAASVRTAAKSLPDKGLAVLRDGRLWLPDRVPAAE